MHLPSEAKNVYCPDTNIFLFSFLAQEVPYVGVHTRGLDLAKLAYLFRSPQHSWVYGRLHGIHTCLQQAQAPWTTDPHSVHSGCCDRGYFRRLLSAKHGNCATPASTGSRVQRLAHSRNHGKIQRQNYTFSGKISHHCQVGHPSEYVTIDPEKSLPCSRTTHDPLVCNIHSFGCLLCRNGLQANQIFRRRRGRLGALLFSSFTRTIHKRIYSYAYVLRRLGTRADVPVHSCGFVFAQHFGRRFWLYQRHENQQHQPAAVLHHSAVHRCAGLVSLILHKPARTSGRHHDDNRHGTADLHLCTLRRLAKSQRVGPRTIPQGHCHRAVYRSHNGSLALGLWTGLLIDSHLPSALQTGGVFLLHNIRNTEREAISRAADLRGCGGIKQLNPYREKWVGKKVLYTKTILCGRFKFENFTFSNLKVESKAS